MQDYDDALFPERDRCEEIALYMIHKQCTVRAAAARFGVSKSTVHKDVTSVLMRRNPALYSLVAALLAKNKTERHIRGGEATRQKYIKNLSVRNGADKG